MAVPGRTKYIGGKYHIISLIQMQHLDPGISTDTISNDFFSVLFCFLLLKSPFTFLLSLRLWSHKLKSLFRVLNRKFNQNAKPDFS